MHFKSLIWQIFYIITLAVISGIVVNSISVNGISLVYSKPDISSEQYLSAELAFELFKEGRALFVDSRYPEEFEKTHIKNAINIPASWPVDQVDQITSQYDRQRLIVVYCSGPECNSSARVTGILKFIKFSNVYIFSGGMEEWQVNKYPLTRN